MEALAEEEDSVISGFVRNGREAIISVAILSTDGRQEEIEAVIDTGFTNYLTLPYQVISHLGLSWNGQQLGTLADGREQFFDYYAASIVWDDEAIPIPVNAIDSEPLVGMALMEGYALHIEVIEAARLSSNGFNTDMSNIDWCEIEHIQVHR